jgi:uncharacterized protein (DUF2237 family)
MSLVQIKHRFTAAVLFEGEYDSRRACLEAAVKAGADLAGANLAGADLMGANLADANLMGANLTGANLMGAYLTGACLMGANLTGANLMGANLTGAYLMGANLTGANLACANLTGANLMGADLMGAYLADANLADAKNVGEANGSEVKQSEPADRAERQRLRAQRYREQHPEVPVVEALDAKLLSILESGKGKLKMSTWHTCLTTHCRAGWAITLAGDAGKVLEEKYGPQCAGTLIYRASTGHVPHFFATNERALEDIREQAALQVQAS